MKYSSESVFVTLITIIMISSAKSAFINNHHDQKRPSFSGESMLVLECDACNLILPIARLLIKNNQTDYLKFVCSKLKIEDPNVCDSILTLYKSSVINVAKYSPLSSEEICSAFLQCSPVTNPIFNWNITLPSTPKPPIKPHVLPSKDSQKLRILHLSDIHADFEYQPGSIANCDQPLCCRNSSTTIKGSKKNLKAFINDQPAGYWGDYRNCDVPLWTVENMFEHISKTEQFDFIYMTGDIPPHNVWNQTKDDQINAVSVLTNLFLKYFPNKIIFPTLGNHEAAPCNLFPSKVTNEDNITWLYNALAESWTKTGLPSELKENITKGAFYTIKVTPGLRLISLNMNYCYNLNFWLLIDSFDPLGQLAWLVDILQQSEDNKEKVHIIGHVDPMGCFDSWSKNYYAIVNRYEATIAGQFFGHTHFDQFEMFYDLNNNTRPVGVAYIAGSITSFSHENPNYRIYSIDGNYSASSFEVLDHETYFMNLTEANLSMKPLWKKEYSAKQAFGMESLYPQDWGNLLDSMLMDLNGSLVEKLYKFYSSSADGLNFCENSKDLMECRKNFVCTFKQARSDKFIQC